LNGRKAKEKHRRERFAVIGCVLPVKRVNPDGSLGEVLGYVRVPPLQSEPQEFTVREGYTAPIAELSDLAKEHPEKLFATEDEAMQQLYGMFTTARALNELVEVKKEES